jgi:tRNA(adenine34) deaminase
MHLTAFDISFFHRAIVLANVAEKQDNLPIGAVITYEQEIVAEGRNAIWSPTLSLTRHAEIEALHNVPEYLWSVSRNLTLYTTLEPCLMCLGAILLHQIGRVLYGSTDGYGGASLVIGHMPTYFAEQISRTELIGPAYPEECDQLYKRVMELERRNSSAKE